MRIQALCLLSVLSLLAVTQARAEGRAIKMCQDEVAQPVAPLPAEPSHDVVGVIGAITHKLKGILLGAGTVLGEAENYIAAERWTRGKTRASRKAGVTYEQWDHVVDRLQEKAVSRSLFPPRQSGASSLLNDDGYRREMTSLISSSSEFVPGNKVEPLVNGCASFIRREELIDHAQESIHIFVWAIYDDETGREFSDWLNAAKNRRISEGADLDIRIIVDGNLSKELGTRDVLAQIEAQTFSNGSRIHVVRLKDKHGPYFGMHRKLMIVDGRHVVMGGMNVGNIYSHLGPSSWGLWRDTDVYVTGPVVNQAEEAFVSDWNEQAPDSPLVFSPAQFAENPGSVLSMLVDHHPLQDDNTYLAIMKAFYGATRSIDIENAYVIADPVNERAIEGALKRGVKVRILSNSKDSIDEPVMTTPIMQSLARLQALGAQIFLKKVYPVSSVLQGKGPTSTTLHSKFLVVDGIFTAIGSYNMHPRSYRYEREVILASFDESLAKQLEDVFEADTVSDRALGPNPESLNHIKVGLLNKIVDSDFFDQL